MFSLRKILTILAQREVIFLLPILFFFTVSQGYAMEVTLAWDPNSEPDLAGYKVYYKAGSSGEPYDGTGATEGNSPIDVSNTTTCTVTGLIDGVTYFFVVTAYDSEGLESDYSNEVATSPEPTAPESPTGAGRDDGGGCFIATAAFGSNMDRHVQILSQFRDKRLANDHRGQRFIALYNKFSPPIAGFLRRHPLARAAVRYGLTPITGVAYVALYVHPGVLLLGFILLLLTGVYCARRFHLSPQHGRPSLRGRQSSQ